MLNNVFKTRGFLCVRNFRNRIPRGSVKCGGIKDISGNNKFNNISRKFCYSHVKDSDGGEYSPEKLEYLEYLNNWNTPILICTGPTGSGKTYLACSEGLKQLSNKTFKKILITRPTVSIENEQVGFLPGNLDRKMDPWVRPVYDNIVDLVGIKEFEQLLRYKMIEICPIAYVRGRTFKDTFIIADEMQNSTKMQFQTLLTRIGEESKIVINGDLTQTDNITDNGLHDFIKRLKNYSFNTNYIHLINLQESDIIRHPCIHEILSIYSQRE
jgi:phosphate starvation-inducible PhoH-like protein